MTMEYAIVKTGGKQYKVSEGTILEIDRLAGEEKNIVLSDVLLLVSEGKIKIGKPILPDTKVKATLLENIKGDKIRVAKFKAKAKYRRVMGFRPQLSRLEIGEIISGGKASKEESDKKTPKKAVKAK